MKIYVPKWVLAIGAVLLGAAVLYGAAWLTFGIVISSLAWID